MFERIGRLITKEFIQVLRDVKMRLFIFVPPLIQLLIFGYAVTTDVNNVATAVFDLDRSYESRELVRRMEASGYFRVKVDASSPAAVQELLDRGEVTVAIQINNGFARDVKGPEGAVVQVLVDGTDSNTALIAMNYATRIIAKFGTDLGFEKLNLSAATLDVRPRAWYNPELRSRNYNVPGVIAIMILLICLILTSMAIVREREIGTLEQLMVTPLRPIELILGKTIPFGIIGLFDMFLVTVAGVFWFNIPIVGSLPLLTLCTVIYLLSVLGIGLFISTVSKTQQQALMATFLFFAPAVLLSGFMFPIENMPMAVQYGTYLNPLRYFLVIIRGIFLKGNGVAILWPQMAALLILGVFVLTISALRFKKRIG